jgi:hypothetical protein
MSEGAVDLLARVRETLSALDRGELEAVDALMADDVRWTGVPPGPGDCLNRTEVRQMLASWYEEGAIGPALVFAVDAQRVGVATSREGVETLHVLTFAGDRVIAVQACPDRAAINALPAPDAPAAGGAAPVDGSRTSSDRSRSMKRSASRSPTPIDTTGESTGRPCGPRRGR